MKLAVLLLACATLAAPATAGDFQTISLTPIANTTRNADYDSLHVGDTILGGVPFYVLPYGQPNEFSTESAGYGQGLPASGRLGVTVRNAEYAHVLMCGTCVHQQYMNTRMGDLLFGYADGSQDIVPLVVGENIRDGVTLAGCVTSTTSSSASTVWSGVLTTLYPGSECVVTKLTVPLSQGTLTSITFLDTASPDPGITVFGVTVEYRAVPEPSSALVLLCGIGGLGGVIWKWRPA